MSKRDYYEILGIAKTSSDDEIKTAYRRLASKLHPDKVSGEDEKKIAEEKFKEVKEAYEFLSDSQKRKQYDTYGHQSEYENQHKQWAHGSGASAAEFDEILRQFMSGRFNAEDMGFGRHTQSRTSTYPINITLVDAYIGRTVVLDSKTSINLPKGVRSGAKFYADGKLYRVEVAPHNKFKRSEDDLLVELSITAIEAMLGVEAKLEHLDGTILQFTIPAGIQSGQIVKLSGRGMKNPETDKKGDILVRISVTVPRSLSETDKTILKGLSHRESINI